MFSIAQAGKSLLCADTTVSAVSAKMEKQDLDRSLNREKWGYSKIFDVIYKPQTTSKNAGMSSSGPAWRGLKNKYTLSQLFQHVKLLPNIHSQKHAVPQEWQQ